MEEEGKKGGGGKGGENQAGAGKPRALDEKPDPGSIWGSWWIHPPNSQMVAIASVSLISGV